MTTEAAPGQAYLSQTHRAMIIARIVFSVVLAAGIIVTAILFLAAIPGTAHAVSQSATVTAASTSVDAAKLKLVRATSDLRQVKEASARVDPSDSTGAADFDDTISIDTVAQKQAARELQVAQENLLKARALDGAQTSTANSTLVSAGWVLVVSVLAVIIAGAFLIALTLTAGRAVAMVELARPAPGAAS